MLLVGKKSGAGLLADAAANESADLTLQARLGTATDFDVWGVLPGSDPSRRVFVGTPASSFVPASSERGGGVAILLGLARHYALEPRSQRPETLVFLATSGHEVGFLGLEALIEARGPWFTDADAYVHMGASLGAPTGVEDPDGSVTVTPVPPAGLKLPTSAQSTRSRPSPRSPPRRQRRGSGLRGRLLRRQQGPREPGNRRGRGGRPAPRRDRQRTLVASRPTAVADSAEITVYDRWQSERRRG